MMRGVPQGKQSAAECLAAASGGVKDEESFRFGHRFNAVLPYRTAHRQDRVIDRRTGGRRGKEKLIEFVGCRQRRGRDSAEKMSAGVDGVRIDQAGKEHQKVKEILWGSYP